MLQAKSDIGVIETLATRSREEIEKLRQTRTYYCPVCNERVILKAGSKMVPHFAHYSNNNCPANEGGEGAYHETGKLKLYQWLRRQRLQAELEAYIPEINQRPDILLHLLDKRIAIEYQCARISAHEIQKRNEGYHSANIYPIWILGANHFQRKGSNVLKINEFLLQFMQKLRKTDPLTIYFFDPTTDLFSKVQDIWMLRKSLAHAKFTFKKLNNFRFKEIFHPRFFERIEIIQHWKKAKRNFRLRSSSRVYGNELKWRQWLYLKQMHIEQLPSIIYLPVASQYLLKLEPWNWQSRICLDHIAPLPIGGEFSILSLTELYFHQYHKRENFPLIHTHKSPIAEYLQYLTHLQYLQKIDSYRYKKMNEFHSYFNIEAALMGDQQLIDKLLQNFRAYYEHES